MSELARLPGWLWWLLAIGIMVLVGLIVVFAFWPRSSAPMIDSSEGLRIHPLYLGPSNAYLIETEQGLILVDAGLPGYSDAILRKLRQLGRDDLRLIYITHAHVDHYGSAAAIQRATGAPIAVHEADVENMETGATELGTVRDWEWLSRTLLPWVQPALKVEPTAPDVVLREGDRLDKYGLAATVVHTPGHTPGSTTLITDGGVAVVGDLISGAGGPHAQRSYADDWVELAESLQRVQQQAPDVVFAGHGRTSIYGAAFAALSPYLPGEVTPEP
ncbi:MAG: MBL fold metallo-hydrolase [Anaerolineales bacterium]|nr:MBL fold metallo-hydrolase [Anaerolineales bacterium]